MSGDNDEPRSSGSTAEPVKRVPNHDRDTTRAAVDFAKQAEKLAPGRCVEGGVDGCTTATDDFAVEAKFVTPQDAVIVTAHEHHLPGVAPDEAHRLNVLREKLNQESQADGNSESAQTGPYHALVEKGTGPERGDARKDGEDDSNGTGKATQQGADGTLQRAMPPSHTHPLFPPLPVYGPPSLLRDLQCYVFRVTSFFLSLAFLGVIVLGALFTSIPGLCWHAFLHLTLQNPERSRPLYEEEVRRRNLRREQERAWKDGKRRSPKKKGPQNVVEAAEEAPEDEYVPTEGGPDPVICDVGYYARRVGLDVEEFEVQTEDGFIIDLWHVYDPREHERLPAEQRTHHGPDVFLDDAARLRRRAELLATASDQSGPGKARKPRFPVLLIHGLLQSAGAYCVNDDDSLAFYLCKAGFDVWLGNNRCGFTPKHTVLRPSDPRAWCWNIRQMGVFDLPALASRALYETGFDKLGLVAHSQGTTETLVALAKEQRPDLGERITVFCALAPAAYAGPLIGKMYFKFMRVITPGMFRLMFGIHAFIPFMMTMHAVLPGRVYGWLGYRVFSFLFDWTDARWDRGLRDRMFQFAPVYVSAESMRWWLGRECFARHKCILATKDEWRAEDWEDGDGGGGPDVEARSTSAAGGAVRSGHRYPRLHRHHRHHDGPYRRRPKGSTAWYDARVPPLALWICGRDDLVDGHKLLRRFERGREPHVRLVHAAVLPEYAHLDILWAMDAPDRVFREVKEVLWRTCHVRDQVRVPKGCEHVEPWVDPKATAAGKMEEAGGRLREVAAGNGRDESPESSSSNGTPSRSSSSSRERSP